MPAKALLSTKVRLPADFPPAALLSRKQVPGDDGDAFVDLAAMGPAPTPGTTWPGSTWQPVR
jgi:hypothetical protein